MGALFHDGPAAGLLVDLTTLPFYLRVAIEPNVGAPGVLSGTQQPYDGEDVAVYVRPGEVLRITGQAPTGTYVWLDEIDGDDLRDPAAWQAWASAQPPAGQGRVGDTTWPQPATAGTGA